MSTQTPNLNLTKPDVNDHISDTIPALATNFQTIDTSVTNNTNNITTIQNQMMTKTTAVQPSQLPAATTTALGGVKQGANVTIDADGTLHTADPYTLPVATSTTLGGVKQGSNVTIAADGTLSATATQYTLPVATATTLGGVKQGSNVTIAPDGTLSAQTSYTLPGDVAKVDVAQTWTQDQTIGSNGTATSGSNAPSHYLKFNRNKWNGSAGVDATNMLGVDVGGALKFFNESGSSVASVDQSGNTLLSGNLTVTGSGSFNGYNVLTTGSSIAASQLPVATSTTIGGVKAGTNISIAADGTISASGSGGGSAPIATTTTPGTVIVSDPNMGVDASGNLSLSSNVAKLGTTQTFTQTQGLAATNTATSSTNYGSNSLAFYRSYWNGSGAITANSMVIGVDGTGMLSFTNESSAMPFKVTQVGDGTFSNSVHAPIVYSSGMSGATASSRYVGATASGAPTTGTFTVGDFIIDQSGSLYICTTAGTPGSWTQVKANGYFGSNAITSSANINTTAAQAYTAGSASGTPRYQTGAPGSTFFGFGPNSSSADNTARIGNSNGSTAWSTPTGTFILKSDGALQATGLTGATAASRYVGATASGAPASGTFAVGDFVIDQTGKVWICTTAGTPGTWTQVGGGTNHLQSRIALIRSNSASLSTTSQAIAVSSSQSIQFKYNASEWTNATFYFEGNIYSSGTGSTTAYAGLWDITASAAVSGSEISTTNVNTSAVTLRSSSIALTDGHVYSVYLRTSSSSYNANLTGGDLIALY